MLNDTQANQDSSNQEEAHHPYRVHLPGFITNEEVGLGDLIKRATSVIGIQPCSRCEQRATMLNRWITFSGQG
jgi:hypothetical protein